ncbi:MAG: NUDIX hydrolase [Deltaproteobacteria bacterium]|nr:NUDIX hydrolase [Deltaproteobacteria bacterium]
MVSGNYPQQPVIAVGAVVTHQNRILLIRRGKEPARGEWAIPGGRVELGETMREAVAREVMEETCVSIHPGDLVYFFETIQPDPDGRIRFHYAIFDFMAEYLEGEPNPRDDAMDARWVSAAEADTYKLNIKTRDLLNRIGFINTQTLIKL